MSNKYWEIDRTSAWDSKPCPEAIRAEGYYVDVRCTNDPTKIPAYKGHSDWWYNEGTNHRLIGKQIARDFPDKKHVKWLIPVEEMDIPKFAKKYGRVVVSMGRDDCDVFDEDIVGSIEIYDNYRE